MKYKQEENFRYYQAYVEVLYVCQNIQCNEFFIAYFEQQPDVSYLVMRGTRPIEPVPLDIEESVRQISAAFCAVYEEAHKAEQFGLIEICGVGYRKSLEFLINTKSR